MWLGTEEGQVFILDAVTKHTLLDRHLAVLPGQGISSIHHILTNRYVSLHMGIVNWFHLEIAEDKHLVQDIVGGD